MSNQDDCNNGKILRERERESVRGMNESYVFERALIERRERSNKLTPREPLIPVTLSNCSAASLMNDAISILYKRKGRKSSR